MHPAAEAAIGAGNNVLAANRVRVSEDPVGHELGVLDHVGGVADDARDKDFTVRQFDVAPDLVLVLVPDVAGFDRIRPAP